MSEYNKEFLDYKTFFEKYENEIFSKDKEKIETINNNCLNKSFFYMLFWQKWVQLEDTVSYYIYDSNKEKYSKIDKKTSFNDINLFPYQEDGKDILPIMDIREIFITLNFGEKNSILDSVYDFIFSKIENENKIERLDGYIDQIYSSFQKSVYGLYIDIISLSEKDKNNYISDFEVTNGGRLIVIEEIYKQNFTFKDINKNSIEEKINQIKKTDFRKLNEIDEYNLIYKIDVISSNIYKLMQAILDYITYTYRLLLKEQSAENTIDLKKLFTQPEGLSIPIDRMIELIGVKPKFKKSYIVRENNLFGYVKIKMIKNIENIGYLEVDNFSVPYNHILDFEYNIKEQTASLKLIDTEGNLSELLINKMYSFFNTNVKAIAQNEQEEIAQYFEIEYGWSGPETENIGELLKENIFVKKIFRGYIKSISSQFSSNGTNYEISITPNPFKKNASINTYDIFFENSNEASISLILIFSYLIFKNFDIDSLENFNGISDKDFYTVDAIFLEKIFYILLEKDFYIRPNKEKKKKPKTISYSFGIVSSIAKKDDIYQEFCTIGKDNTTDFNLIELLVNNLKIKKFDFFTRKQETIGNKKETLELYHIVDMKTLDNDGIISATLNGNLKLNAWIVGVFLILKLKHYFLKKNNVFFVFYDITEIFDVFNLNPKELNSLNKEKTLFTVFTRFIFNYWNNDNAQTRSEKKLLENIKNQYTATNFSNSFDISEIILKQDTKYEKRDAINHMSFFTKKIEEIFKKLNRFIFMHLANLDYEQVSQQVVNNTIEVPNGSIKGFFQTFDKTKTSEIKDLYQQTQQANSYQDFLQDIDNTKRFLGINDEEQKEINILFTSFEVDQIKVFKSDSISVEKKVEFLSQNILQSYSLTPRIYPKTRNSNKQFFSQGNDNLLNEGAGDIIEFQINSMNMENIMMATTINKNQKNIGFNDFSSHNFSNGIYENAAKYYSTYTDINGKSDKLKIASDMASLQEKYRSQIQISGSITIHGEPYWSDINLLKKYIYLNIYYSNGTKSSHSGLYMMTNAIHNITNGKYTTTLEIIRQNTFLSNFSIKGETNTFLM